MNIYYKDKKEKRQTLSEAKPGRMVKPDDETNPYLVTNHKTKEGWLLADIATGSIKFFQPTICCELLDCEVNIFIEDDASSVGE